VPFSTRAPPVRFPVGESFGRDHYPGIPGTPTDWGHQPLLALLGRRIRGDGRGQRDEVQGDARVGPVEDRAAVEREVAPHLGGRTNAVHNGAVSEYR